MHNVKIAFIGCGDIAHYHADVLRAHGANLTAASYRNNLERANEFASKYSIKNVYQNWQTMVSEESLDALWVCASWDEIDNLLVPVANLGIPVFFEKPVALSSERIIEALATRSSVKLSIQVGYNRRFYTVISHLREKLRTTNMLAVEVFVPEQMPTGDQKLRQYKLLQNSSHILDLIYYLTGTPDLTIKQLVNAPRSNQGLATGFQAIMQTAEGIPVYISSIWNAPQNFSLRVYTSDETVFELRPIERLRVFKGFEVIEPTPQIPIRIYNPLQIDEIVESPVGGFKPGFEQQALHFFSNTFQGKRSEDIPDLNSCLRLTRLCEDIRNAR